MDEINDQEQRLNQNTQQDLGNNLQDVSEIEAIINREIAVQKESLNNLDTDKTKTRKTLVLILSVCIMLLIVIPPIFKLFNNDNSLSEIGTTNVQEHHRFTPISKIGDEVQIKGLIKGSDYEEENYEYVLSDGYDGVIAYLYSNDIDLSLSTNLNAEVNGKVTSNYKGSIVIKVNEIKLK